MLKRLTILAVALAFSAQAPLFSQEGRKKATELRMQGIAYSRSGQTVEAIDAYVAALAVDPTLQMLYIELTDLFLSAGLPDEASSMLQRARQMFPHSELPEYGAPYYRLGNVYINSGRLGQAEDAM